MSQPASLYELLRRCHRDELLPLARVLRVKPDGMGLKALARHLDRTLRRRARHEARNLLARGEGPSYEQVVAELGRQAGVEVQADAIDTETRLFEWAVARSWDEMDAERRGTLWRQLGMSGSPPEEGETAVVVARNQLGRGFGYALGLSVVGGLVRTGLLLVHFLTPLSGCFAIWWLGRPRYDQVFYAVMEVAHLRQVVMHRVTIGVVGSPSCGKDAAIAALFGVHTGNIDPVAGSTREVSITRLQDATALYVVNTPGLGDVVESVTEEARQVLDHIDLFIYIVNAQGGVQARELEDWKATARSGRPALAVVNKVDTLRGSDRQRYLDDARDKLGVAPKDFLAAAFDPLPQLSEEPLGVAEVQAWITRELEALGKDPAELPWVEEGG